MGVPLFQEQAMKLAMVAARFTDVEANQLRRAMATFRHVGTMERFEAMMVERMVARGYERDFAERCFKQIEGFGSYGFPESHAASFAKLVYISSWIKCHHPAIFACALLNAQPMGFYAPAQIVRDAQEHGVEVRPVDVNGSCWDSTLEPHGGGALALRIGLRQIDGFHQEWAERLVAYRGAGYISVEELATRTALPVRALQRLADADAVRSLGLDRRDALWAVRRLPDDAPLPLFAAADARELGEEPDAALPAMRASEQVAVDYQTLRLSLKGHPMGFLRPLFDAEGVASCAGTGARPGRRLDEDRRPRVGAPAPGQGQRDLHHARRRDRHHQCAALGPHLRALPPGGDGRAPSPGGGPGSAQPRGGGASDRRAGFRPHGRTRAPDRRAAILGSSDDTLVNPRHAPGSRHPRDVRILPKSRDFH
jgi:error-prone DNA polymerase